MIVTLGGPPGSGKTTVARKLSEKLEKELVVVGEIFRSLAKEKGYTLAEFGEIASNDHSIDRALDEKIVKIAEKGDMILEGRLAGIMLTQHKIPAFKIWLDAEIEERARRITGRDGGDIKDVKNRIQKREQCEKERYREIYGVIYDDSTLYDLVVDTSKLSAEEVVDLILDKLKV